MYTGRILQACIIITMLKAAFCSIGGRDREQPSSPQERYGDEEGAEALFDDAPPPGDEEEEGEELFDQNFDVR